MNKVTQKDIEALIELFDKSDWRELSVCGEGIDLFLSKDPNARRPRDRSAMPSVAASTSDPATAPIATAIAAAPRASPYAKPSNWVTVLAPTLGTFYSAPKPGAPPFVSVGQHVSAETEICLVEVMKLFTTVRAGVAGIVRERLATDAQLVEYGQTLFFIEPDV